MIYTNPTQHVILTVIGCGDAFSSGGRAQTCFHLDTPEGSLLIDCGAGALAGLKQNRLPLENIGVIVISHFHGDHYGGVPYILLELAIRKHSRQLTVISPAGAEEKLAQLLHLLYPGTAVLEVLNIRFLTFSDQPVTTHNVKLTAFPVIHTAETSPHGIRIETCGRIISFSGDTGWTDTLFDIARQSDLFLCECSFYKYDVKGHLNYVTLIDRVDSLECKQILLTHCDDQMDEYQHEVHLPRARDNMRVIL